ncbi:penicillin acylase family protein [Thermoflavimicrobium daqui]|jgi:penicillin amidase|uniref:Penicillin acylase family protein n=1 Tax=Thermoflavimicrobium daqui TaxID=2137476 RepID=A0A364K0M3_9BACL|nr:penicillin acylase family protein [Thermoflavimicrobium daqui]RAL21056.1 penicillin acylase family protein [Thermoflavimicrobium daqui]
MRISNTVIVQKRIPIRKWLPILAMCMIYILLFLGSFGYWLLSKSLPSLNGEISIQGLQAPVKVWRDKQGVPHIEANNLHDLFMVQGYVTAQDRLFQMDLSRRQASGTLSEVIGSKTINQDRFFRTFGLHRAAIASYSKYPKEYQDYLKQYAKGVNAYIQDAIAKSKLPIEFTILGYQPKPWTPIDSLTIGKYMAYDLGGHWEGQAFRYYLLQRFPKEKALDLFPSYPEHGPDIIEKLQTLQLDLSKSFASAVVPHPFNGSNNWVISGEKSVSGKPMLANDPHLSLASPAIWYETHLTSPQVNVSGVIFAGVPGIIVGHTKHIAWGVTNVGPDVQDLYIEKRNPKNQNQFLYQGKWENAQIIHERIKVKDGKDIILPIQITRHGPIISEFAHSQKPDTALSLKWTALEPSTELQAILLFAQAKNWNEFKQALTYFHAPAQNFVFASTDGTIAYRANGKIPIRKKGDGLLPVPGWTDEYEWKGYIPWDQLPTWVNPEQGFIATANNRVMDHSYPFHLTHTWAEPYRQSRIIEVLQSKEKLTVEDIKKLQVDNKNLQAKEFNPLFVNLLNKQLSTLRPIEQQALAQLKSWNLQDDKELAAPLIYHMLMNKIEEFLFKKQIDPQMDKLFDGKFGIVSQLIQNAASGKEGPWIKEKGGLEKVVLESFKQAIDQITAKQGTNPSEWKWGEFHQITFAHPLSSVKPLDLLFTPPSSPLNGSHITVGAAGWKKTGEVNHGAAWRTVVDLAHPLQSWNVVSPGQSGQVLSPWYHNQIDDWVTGKQHLTSMEPKQYQADSDLLLFTPE